MESLREVYRPNWGRKVPLAFAVLVFLLTLIAAILQPGGALFSYVWRVSMPVVSAIVILALLMAARPCLEISEHGLVVVNIFQKHRLDWNQVLAVRFAKDAPWASLDLADGTKLNVMAIQNSDGLRARKMATEIANRASR